MDKFIFITFQTLLPYIVSIWEQNTQKAYSKPSTLLNQKMQNQKRQFLELTLEVQILRIVSSTRSHLRLQN